MSDTGTFTASRPLLAIAGFLIVVVASGGVAVGTLWQRVTSVERLVDHIDAQGTAALSEVKTRQLEVFRRLDLLDSSRETIAGQYAAIDHRLTVIEGKLDGAFPPAGSLSKELQALTKTVADAARAQEATREQLNALIEALGRSRQGMPLPVPHSGIPTLGPFSVGALMQDITGG